MSNRYALVRPGGGPNYDWSADHTCVKVSAADTGGQYTLMEDNLKANFALGLHMHRHHAETFYVLEGTIDFHIDGDWHSATPGTCIHIPPGVPHACVIGAGQDSARMLMIYQPSGFDLFLAEMATMNETDFADAAKMAALNEKYDIVPLGDVPHRT